jgi:hypothetical protein
MRSTIIGLFIFSLLILLGCSQLRDQQSWKIKNDSTSDLYVEFTHELEAEIRLDTVKAGEEKLVYYKEGILEGEDLEDPTMFADLLIYNTMDTLVKDENLKTNWEITIKEIGSNKDVMKCDYIFSVCDSNF